MLKNIILNNILPAFLAAALWVFLGDVAAASEAKVSAIKLPRDMQAGFNYGAYVRLNQPAPVGGLVVALVTDAPFDMRMPGYLLIKEGQKAGRFPIYISEISKGRIAHVAVSDGASSVAARIRLHAGQSQSRTVFQRREPMRWQVPADRSD